LPSALGTTAGQYNATIDWGDGTSSAGTVRQADNSPFLEVVGDHTYQREGPYVITVRAADTKNQVGGFAASLAYIGNVTSEEDIQRLADENSVQIQGGSQDGLTTETHLDRVTGHYSVQSSGKATYGFQFQLDSVNGNGVDHPSTQESGKGGDLTVSEVSSSGTFNALDFSTATVQTYDVTVSGEMK